MIRAVVLIRLTATGGDLNRILDDIRRIGSNIEWVHLTYGPDDAIASVVANDMQQLNEIISKIRAVSGVAGTDTRIVAA
jgi:DNA-binding Lrp family transcriptional regulator